VGEASVFRGVQNINMDAKGRLAIPTRQRDRLLELCGGEIVITVDTQSPCLVIYPMPEWEEIEKVLDNLPSLKPGVRRLQRLILGYATDLKLDGNGRVLLPRSLRDYAELDKSLVLAGQGKKLELWSEDRWAEEMEAEIDPTELPEDVQNLRL
jgi:MraZ protein